MDKEPEEGGAWAGVEDVGEAINMGGQITHNSNIIT
jgi:hypothetical protein